MNELRKFLSAIVGLLTWLIVGLIASIFVSAKLAVIIGFGAFWTVAMLIYPKEKRGNENGWRG